MTRLAVQGLSVRHGTRLVLDDLTLTAAAGEFIGVIGPNGAGKSTLLAALAGLLRPTRGRIELDGRDLYRIDTTTLARRRAYLPQNPRCEWPISVERLVTLGLTPILPAVGRLPATFAQRITAVLRECDLLERRLQPATTLSGGELARAMLARALVGDPDILIVDEPVAGLDPRHALDAMQRLASCAGSGKLVIASIHDLTLAARHATRILAIAAGRPKGDGPTATTLTSTLIRETFNVEACVSGEGATRYVDYAVRGSGRGPAGPPGASEGTALTFN